MDKPTEPTTPATPGKQDPSFMTLQRLGTVTGITLANIAAFGGLGYWLDGLWGIKPWLMIIGLVIAFPISQFEIYVTLKKMLKP